MRIATIFAGALLGLLFIAFPSSIMLGFIHMPPPGPGTAAVPFWAALGPTGYIRAVMILQIIGGILVALPRTRNFGLLILGPIVINILFYHTFITKGDGLIGPPLLVAVLAAFLLFAERGRFAGLGR